MNAKTTRQIVDANAKAHGTEQVATEYLKFLYTPQGQEIAARNFYRPRDQAVLTKYAATFPKLDMVTIQDFGGWAAAQKRFFADGVVFDAIYGGQAKRR